MWIHDNWRLSPVRTTKRKIMLGVNVLILVLGFFFLIAGTYGAVVDLIAVTKEPMGKPWSCADNSGSVASS